MNAPWNLHPLRPNIPPPAIAGLSWIPHEHRVPRHCRRPDFDICADVRRGDAYAPIDPDLSSHYPAEIEAQFQRFADAWATRDPDVVTALFTDEPVLLPTVSNTPRTTPAGVRDYFVSFLRNQPVARLDTSTIEIDCHTASRVGTWTVTLTDTATGQARDVQARYSFIYRFEDSTWKIDHLHSSMMPAAPLPAH